MPHWSWIASRDRFEFLFICLMDNFVANIHDEVPWFMLFVDDVLVKQER